MIHDVILDFLYQIFIIIAPKPREFYIDSENNTPHDITKCI